MTDASKMAFEILSRSPLLRIKLSRALFCTPDECKQALAEVIKFMILAAEAEDDPVTPSARVDVAWHEFILFTRIYISFCQEKFGRLIHYEPSSDHQSNARQYARTLELYRQRFGEPPAMFWGRAHSQQPGQAAAFCGNCEAGS